MRFILRKRHRQTSGFTTLLAAVAVCGSALVPGCGDDDAELAVGPDAGSSSESKETTQTGLTSSDSSETAGGSDADSTARSTGTAETDLAVDAGPTATPDSGVDSSGSDSLLVGTGSSSSADPTSTALASTLENTFTVEDAGLDGGAEDAGQERTIRVVSIEELADESASAYQDNEHGLISGYRLKHWVDDWQHHRPSGIEGRLVVLQVVPSGVTTEVHVSANEADGVYSYLVAAGEFNAPRNNGLSAFESDIPDGEAADAWLEKYAIDPRKDFILLTFEDQPSTTSAIVQSVGRAWVFLKYWGVAKEHVGILNGSVNWNAQNEDVSVSLATSNEFSVPTNGGTVTVRDLGVDATVLSISLEEIIAILKEEDGAPDIDEVRIVDARGGAEALGLDKATSTGRTDCASYTGTAPNAKCSTPFEGRIKGARSVPWTQFLDSKANGFRFLPPDQVKALFDEQANWGPGAEWTIQYCRTNQRSTVTGIVANVILGYPTRLYETSFIEWGHASTTPGVVPEAFTFRTDLPELTEHAELHPDDVGAYTPGGTLGSLTQPVTWVAGPNYNDAEDVSPASVQPWPGNASGWPKLDVGATTTRLAIDTDRAYLRGISVEELEP